MERTLTKAEWQRKRRMMKYVRIGILCAILIFILLITITGISAIFKSIFPSDGLPKLTSVEKKFKKSLKIDKKFLDKDANTRSGYKLEKVNGIIIHYIGDSGQSAANRWKYFDTFSGKDGGKASIHFIIGFDGEIIQSVPADEVVFASGRRDVDSISIEYAHEGVDGEPKAKTYESLVRLTAFLAKVYNLSIDDVKTHSEISEKGYRCPPYFANDAELWEQFKTDVGDVIKKDLGQ